MVSLDSASWKDFPDAYNKGEEIPALLLQLQSKLVPKVSYTDEPWFSLWSSLCHQGDVYPASFAAVPHILEILKNINIDQPAFDFFALPASIELSRIQQNVSVPQELQEDYFYATKGFQNLASEYLKKENIDPLLRRGAAGMVLVAEGKLAEAENILDPHE